MFLFNATPNSRIKAINMKLVIYIYCYIKLNIADGFTNQNLKIFHNRNKDLKIFKHFKKFH